MLNSSNEVNTIIESGTKAVESVGHSTRNLVDISLSGRYVKRPDESDEAYQARLNFLSQRQSMKAEERLKKQGIKAEIKLRKQEIKAEAQEKQRERKYLRQMQRQEAKLLKQKERIERKQNKR